MDKISAKKIKMCSRMSKL